MEYLIMMLPYIFSIISGVLVAWGIQTTVCLGKIVFASRSYYHHADTVDLAHLIAVALVTTLLIHLLFFVPSFAALHMATFVLLELWYSVYLFYISEIATKTEYQLSQLIKVHHNSP